MIVLALDPPITGDGEVAMALADGDRERVEVTAFAFNASSDEWAQRVVSQCVAAKVTALILEKEQGRYLSRMGEFVRARLISRGLPCPIVSYKITIPNRDRMLWFETLSNEGRIRATFQTHRPYPDALTAIALAVGYITHPEPIYHRRYD